MVGILYLFELLEQNNVWNVRAKATKFRKNMRYWVIFLGIVGLVWACANHAGPPAGTAESTTASDVSGAAVYQQRCVLCHGADGRMGSNGAKVLPESTLTLEERIEIVTQGKGIMPAFREMISREEIEAVAEFTTTLE